MIDRLRGKTPSRRRAARDDVLDPSARPFVRWWWFSGPIQTEDIEAQLDWVKANGFGGVEIAWVYPLDRHTKDVLEWPAWLSPEWTSVVTHAKRHADRLGLGCDFTFGTLWPFGGSIVGVEDAHRTFDGPSPPRLKHTWEEPFGVEPTYVLDHLNRQALERYAATMGAALKPALAGSTSALFCDSWEVSTRRMWSDHLWEPFHREFGYDLRSCLDDLDENKHLRYDYRKFIARAVLEEFYRPFTRLCHELGARSRVQCHGAPTDLIAAYAAVDIPESESLLFNPPFSRIPASAAVLSDRPRVSCETFTCLYGFPDAYHRKEFAADLKLLADGVIAQGVNQIIWHGMPYNAPGDRNRFFATVHVGPDAWFAAQLPELNSYFTRLCSWMSRGKTFTKLAVYLPWEDGMMRNRLPPELRSPAAQYFWEMRHDHVPVETEGYHPLWISSSFLEEATWDGTRLRAGASQFEALHVDCRWLDSTALEHVFRLAGAGLPVILRKRPRRPGSLRPGEMRDQYQNRVDQLLKLPNVFPGLDAAMLTPLVEGRNLPDFWARQHGDDLIIFFAHPGTRDVRYPMTYGQANRLRSARRTVRLHSHDKVRKIALAFPPNQSILIEASREKIDFIDLGPPLPGRGKARG